MTSIYAGIGDCPDCHVRVLFAVSSDGGLVPLDEGRDGPVVVRWDCTDTPRVRPCPPGWRPRDGVSEHRFRLHRDSCRALARVVPLRPRTEAPRRVAERARRFG